MILSATFSKPAVAAVTEFGTRLEGCRKMRMAYDAQNARYDVMLYTDTQCMTHHLAAQEADGFMERHAGTTFRNVTARTESEEIITMTNRHGKIRTMRHSLNPAVTERLGKTAAKGPAHKKSYLLESEEPLPFLRKLGIQNKDGSIASDKNDKFRQISRFLELLDDMIPYLKSCAPEGAFSEGRPLRVTDFGCGKSYLTFAVYWFLREKRGIPVRMTGVDLKADVMAQCRSFAAECGYEGLDFRTGSIETFCGTGRSDLIITLHACDTATDFALRHAVEQGTPAILSVPCCQHEVNAQLDGTWRSLENGSPLAALMQHGILRERFSALATDALRAEYLSQNGYAVQLLEFIDETLTPKNLLIRATRKRLENGKAKADADRLRRESEERAQAVLSALGVRQELFPTARTSL